ncbi:MAG TPA: hypothetical protein VEB19_10340 [Gemmatimonadaceae bacterium]|nr:hypothetical protein [Gemmatimonadaceae bacterium]
MAITTSVALCVYNGETTLLQNTLPPTFDWDVKNGKFSYQDKAGTTANVTAAGFKYSVESFMSSASMSLGGSSFDLNLGGSLAGPVVAQMRTSDGGCFGAAFSSDEVKKNDGEKFTAKEKNEFP